jgi:hypothetical protein
VKSESPFLRDLGVTPFAVILENLCLATGAQAAALVDQEGETVDFAGRGDPFETRILAAELRLVGQGLLGAAHLSETKELTMRARKKSFLVRILPDGYALIVQLGRRASQLSTRPLSVAVQALCSEAGFAPPSVWLRNAPLATRRQWKSVSVIELSNRSHRPIGLDSEDGTSDLTVIGRIPPEEHQPKHLGFRVRLHTGQEGTLVREPLGHWYLEEDSWL